ncbi:conserved membrane hypothetical protein [Candidatus Terasakiella magnetica]|nr:conserved membrane hypothetical protein [Candidatus Terasakiella magnetica]
MRLPRSPLTIFATLCALLVPAGAGLTAPVWLMVMGVPLHRAAEIGARIVGVTTLACAGLVTAYWIFLRPRITAERLAAGPVHIPARISVNPGRDRMVHTIVWMLFVVPFVLIIVGFIVGQLDQVSAD